ncbi:MAG: type II secretion system major pseudopilin GspG, partial [Bdellovibrionota bacterium]
KNNLGMTLMEIMIVLAILGAIFGLLAGRITGARDKAAMREAKIQMGQLTNALSMYYTDCGKYPGSLEGLKKQDGNCSNWGPEAYYKNKLVDPWKHEFVYEGSGGDFTLKSLGRDGKEGGDGYDKDINSEETEEESAPKS